MNKQVADLATAVSQIQTQLSQLTPQGETEETRKLQNLLTQQLSDLQSQQKLVEIKQQEFQDKALDLNKKETELAFQRKQFVQDSEQLEL